jgi:uncharacterized membrane protein
MANMIYRLLFLWLLLHLIAILHEVAQYSRSKKWGIKWWMDNHLGGLSGALLAIDVIGLGILAILLIIAFVAEGLEGIVKIFRFIF